MKIWVTRIFGAILALAAILLLIFGTKPGAFAYPDGSPVPGDFTVLTYWEKWSKQEAQAMRDVVDRYNVTEGRQHKVFVHFVSVSNVDQKTLISTAGGNPPDIAGTWGAQIATFSDYGALLPLTPLLEDGTLTPKTYKPFLWKVVAPKGIPYAAVSTPATVALFWNKDHFKEVGLDPERPPRSIKELDEFAEKLTIRKGMDIQRVGFLPNFPGWWDHDWGVYFGAGLWDPVHHRYTINTPGQIAAYTWYQGYAKHFGQKSVKSFSAGFGTFASPQNPFMSGKVSMCLQGPWFSNFIHIYKPELEGHYGAASVPNSFGQPGDAVIGDLDVWGIPRNAKHPKEAMDVIRFFTRRENIEMLCTAHSKPSPLMDVSREFIEKHPNPYISVFEKDMMSPNVATYPPTATWQRVMNRLKLATSSDIWNEPDRSVTAELNAAQEAADTYQKELEYFQDLRAQREGKAAETGVRR